MFLGARLVDGRPDLTSFSVVSGPHENAYAVQTHLHMITLHHRKPAVSFSSTFPKLHRKLISIFARLNCPRKLDTQSNSEPLQRVAVQVCTRRKLCGGRGIILLTPAETELAGYSWFVCNTSSVGTSQMQALDFIIAVNLRFLHLNLPYRIQRITI